ncbi:hypothetical protein QYE76_050793 [Lolium multiflorum]|uniref:DUF4218 domain-containing protein n=1 Tax=Lolium multiflorum TaxID=4521 RepID=A0AAD8WHM7_LOLMU|nr:hypothetical protein QYE76_050793 [Lolium multiflorum]
MRTPPRASHINRDLFIDHVSQGAAWTILDGAITSAAPTAPTILDGAITSAAPAAPTILDGAITSAAPVACTILLPSGAPASMVLSMSSARISRYKIDAKEDMIRNNRRQIRCPCRSCKLERWINPDSGQLEEHLLRRGFMQDNQARPAPSNGAHEDHVERDDYHHEEDYHHADGDYHHEEEVGGEDHHEEEDAGGEHHHDEEEDSGATPLISALRDSHVQDLLLQETSNDRRYFVDPKEAKLMQWHAERQKPEEDPEMGYMLTHPSDAGQWQALDIAFPRFGGDARNIRLGVPSAGKEATKPEPLLGVWKARSVFHDWKVLHTPHNLDVMHITKNVTESLLGTLCNSKSPRMDRKQDTILNILASGKIFKPPYDDDDDDDRTEGTQCLRKRAKKNAVRFPLPASHEKSIGVRQLKMLQDEIVVILCELEIYFPPAFCDICVHLLLHVVEDIKQLGPTFLHNMMPFERQNGVMKGYVCNRAHPDASMAKGFLTYECISFCQNYLSTDDEDHVGLPPGRTSGGSLESVTARATAQSMSALKIDATTLTGLTGSRYNT